MFTCRTTSCESPLTMSFLIPRSAAILRPPSKPSYSAVLFVACSLGKCIWTTYLRCSPVGATSSTPAPAPCSEKAPSKYISHSLLASLTGMLVSGISSSGVGVHSAMNSANALLWIVEVLSNLRPKLDSSSAHSTILPVASGFCSILFSGKRVTTVISCAWK